MEDIGPYQPIPYQISLLSYESSHSLFNKLPWNQLSWTCLPAVHEQEVNIKSKSIHLHYSQQTPINVILHLIFRQAASRKRKFDLPEVLQLSAGHKKWNPISAAPCVLTTLLTRTPWAITYSKCMCQAQGLTNNPRLLFQLCE